MCNNNYQLATVAACNLVGLDRQRFNEFVASGDYPCAPPTTTGRTRLFDENDLVALFIFARLIETKHYRTTAAGWHACKVLEILRESADDVECVTLSGGLNSPRLEAIDTQAARNSFSVTTYNVGSIRETIRETLRKEERLAQLANELDKETGEQID